MKIVIAPDSFKGSLSSFEVIQSIKQEAIKQFNDAKIVEVPIADGGEGTVEAALHDSEGVIKTHKVKNPLGNLVEAKYGIIGDTAIIEMAACSGLTLIPVEERNPLKTSSFGIGELIKHVLDAGIRKILIGVGGSATNDGGMGAMCALGARFFDIDNNEIKKGCGENLIHIDRICIDNLDKRLKDCDISVMCDVTNPLTGKEGATYVYGAQKGGDRQTLDLLEKGMLSYEEKLNSAFGKDISCQEGAGAAGGMGAALLGFCNAKLVRGIDAILEIVNFEEKIKGADFIVTGEGMVDNQSAFGKVVHGVTLYGNRLNIPVIVIAGGIGDGIEAVYDIGVKAIVTLPNRPMGLDECMRDAKNLIEQLSKNLFSIVKISMNIK